MVMKVLAILTRFKHHGEHSGYKQILKYIKPTFELGINEDDGEVVNNLKSKYQWLFEWESLRYRNHVDIVHVMYGEDYLRFSPYLFRRTPVVATFHQPAVSLEREISRGDLRGKVGRLTHLFTKNRFDKLSAAIVTEKSQKLVLSRVMDENKIHVIPLGVHLSHFVEAAQGFALNRVMQNPNQIVTIGNWLRDWDMYKAVVKQCAITHPDWEFHLVNRRIERPLRDELNSLGVVFHDNISDQNLKKLIYTSSVHFLPVLEASGNNALFESLALGCRIVLTDVFKGDFFIENPAVVLHPKGDTDNTIDILKSLMVMSEIEKEKVSDLCRSVSKKYDWEEVANRTLEVYKSLLKK
jgi:glycosyltransferase involved in cell wall biosynthesis